MYDVRHYIVTHYLAVRGHFEPPGWGPEQYTSARALLQFEDLISQH